MAAVLVATALATLAGEAHAGSPTYRVVVVPGLELSDLEPLEDRAAIGLVVPGAGPRVSEASALAALERGAVRNSLRGGLPPGPALISVTKADAPPTSGNLIVLGLPTGGDQANDRRYPIAVIGDGFEGLLNSGSTRIPGLVSVADVAPTALGLDGGLSSTPSSDPVAYLEDLDQRIVDNGNVRPIASLLIGILVLAFAFVFPRAALLGFATALGANLVLGAAGISSFWAVLLVLGLAVAVGAPLLALAARSRLAVALILTAVIVGYLVAFLVDPTAVALSPLGPSQNSRFYGLSNLLSAMLLVPALAAVALLKDRLGWLPALLLAGTTLVVVAGSRFGADGGGSIVLVVAFAFLAVELADARRRAVVAVVALAVAAVVAVVAIDSLTGASSHLTDAVGGGPSGFAADLKDRVVLSWERATEHWYLALLVVLAVIVLLLLSIRLARSDLTRAAKALPLSIAVAVAVSLVVNDSPLDVVAVGLVGYLTAQAYVLAEPAFERTGSFEPRYRSSAT